MNSDWLWRPARLTGWRAVVLAVLGFAVSVLLIGSLVHGRFFMMDDPTILSWMRVDGRLHLADLPRIIRESEIFKFGEDSRCRPVYWILRMTETALWGDRTALWFSMRVVLFGGVLSAFAWTLVAAVGPAWAAALSLYLAAQFYWGDVWAHASLGEQYAAAGLAMFVVAATVLKERVARRFDASAPLVIMSLGAVIAVGSKENFAFLLLPLFIALYAGRSANVVRSRGAIAVGIATLFTIYVGIGVILGLRRAGIDQYGNAGGLAHRLALFTSATSQVILLGVLALIATAMLLRAAVRKRNAATLPALDGDIRELGLLSVVVVAMLFTQIVYYDGDWPRFGGRYDFPGRLAEVIAAAAAIVAMHRLVAYGLVPRRAASPAGLALVAVIGWSVWHHGFNARDAAKQYVATTTAMYDAVRATLARNPGDSTVPIVLESRDANDFEAAVWTSAVLPFYGGRNPVFLRPPSYAPARLTGDTLFQRPLAITMRKMSIGGEPMYRLRPFTEFPAALSRAHDRCASLLLREYQPMIAVPCAP